MMVSSVTKRRIAYIAWLVPAGFIYGYIRYRFNADVAGVIAFVAAVIFGRLLIDKTIK